jgi:hypothetical protein
MPPTKTNGFFSDKRCAIPDERGCTVIQGIQAFADLLQKI